MSDTINIKVINGQLTWNEPIETLIEKTCYNIDYKTKNVEVFLSRGELTDGIEFWRAIIGTCKIDDLNTSFFNQISFELITSEIEVSKKLQNLFDNTINVQLTERHLTLTYIGNNKKINVDSKLISQDSIQNNFKDFWRADIKSIRHLINSEHRYYSYDFHYKIFYNYGWLTFEKINIFDLEELTFRGYYKYDVPELFSLETIVGSTLSDYEKIKAHLIHKIGQPNEKSSNFNNHEFKDDTWQNEDYEIRLYSAFIPRAEPEQLRYELEIKKYCA